MTRKGCVLYASWGAIASFFRGPRGAPARAWNAWGFSPPAARYAGEVGKRWALVVGLVAVAGLGMQARTQLTELSRPRNQRDSDYVGSDQCRSCHPSHHDSWHRTFHRSMTQEATAETVLGDFDDARFSYGGVDARMSRDTQGRFWMHFGRGPEAWSAQVTRTVGSHRYQQYLAQLPGEPGVWMRLPLAWNVLDGRFMHMNGGFLTPDPPGLDAAGAPSPAGAIADADYQRHVTRWNDNCVFCHNVDARPGLGQDGRFDTHVAELGVACEACHGPGSVHAAHNRSPLRRYLLHLSDRADPTIANPTRMPPARSAEVCGQCHGQRLARDIGQVLRDGDDYLPGEPLMHFSRPLARDTTVNGQAGTFTARFWPDGTPRLTAYEYQGVLQSACATRGPMDCGSCHSMHAADPRGQLRTGADSDAMCTGCHATLADRQDKEAHAQHDIDGPGGRCVNCHMGQVVYGLVDAHRSHRIDVPKPGVQPAAGRPDTCTLCHAGRSRRWAGRALARMWPARRTDATAKAADTLRSRPDTTPDASPQAEVPRLLLAGDPIERAVAAAALGRMQSRDNPVPRRVGLLMDTMLDDDYPAVRAIASRSLSALLPPETLDTLAPFTATDARASRARFLTRLRAQLPAGAVQPPDPDWAAALRAQAARVAIEIGE